MTSLAASGAPAPTSMTWDAPQTVERPLGDPTAISCPTAHHCFIADGSGHLVRVEDGQRVGTLKISDALSSVSCPSIHFCVAGGSDGELFVVRGAHSSDEDVFDTGRVRVSCPSASFCAAVDGSEVADYQDGIWSTPAPLTPSGATLVDISCVASTFCAAVSMKYGDQNVLSHAYQWNGVRWSAGELLSRGVNGMGVSSVSCASPSFCFAAVSSEVFRFGGRHWKSAGFAVYGGDHLSCPTTSFCMAVSGSDVTGGATESHLVHGNWTTARDILNGGDTVGAYVSCSAPKACTAVDVYGDGRRWTGRWESPRVLDRTVGDNASGGPWVSCGAPGHCVAVDRDGNYFTYHSGIWTAARRIAVEAVGMASISCAGARFCVTVDGSAHTWVFNGTKWHQSGSSPLPHDAGRPALVSCGTQTFCMATTGGGLAARFDGQRWSKPAHYSPDRQAWSIACTAAHFCALTALSSTADLLFIYRHGRWNGPHTIPPLQDDPFTATCAGTSCLLTSYSSGLDVFQHGEFTSSVATTGDVAGASCVTATFCVVDEYHSYQIWDGSELGDPAPLAVDSRNDDASISCVAPHFCAAVGLTGAIVGR